jgi:signal transduction histidine kinase/CheY-like chemotaxis protein
MTSRPGLILIVDDHEHNRALLARRLQREGHRSASAANGRQALEMARARSFDLILLDIMMPEMDGYQVLERLRADPVLRHVPVIVISAVNDRESVLKCIELGAEDYLFKPFDRALLQARVNSSLERKRLRDQEKAFTEELLVMQRIDRELNTTLDVERALSITLNWALDRTGAEAGVVGLFEDEGLRIWAAEGYVEAPPTLLPGNGSDLHCGEPCRWAENGWAGLADGVDRVAVPICRSEKIIGCLVLESTDPGYFTQERQAFLSRLIDHAAIAVANAQLYAAVEAANVAKSEFVSLVSHELKTPMTSMKGYLDIVLGEQVGPVNDVQTNFLRIVRSNVDRMAKLVSDLTDVSRIESGRLRLDFDVVSMEDVVAEVLRAMEQQFAETAQIVERFISNDLPPVRGDRSRLVQIMANLLSNAHKYTPQGGSITVRAMCIKEGEEYFVHVAVEDTGIGIHPEDQPNVFTKFFRAQDEAAQQAPGTGLGLNITRDLVEMQGGRIGFESTYGQGTTFYLLIPVAE